MSDNIRLLIDCPDHRGVVAAVSNFIALHNGNIVDADQHVSDPPGSRFFMRMEVESQGFGLGRDEFDAAFSPAGPPARDELAGLVHQPSPSSGHHGLEVRPLPARPPLALGGRRARGRDPAGDLQPSRPGGESPGPRHPLLHLPVAKGAKAEQEAQIANS